MTEAQKRWYEKNKTLSNARSKRWREANREKEKERQAQRRKDKPSEGRNRYLRWAYGMTLEEYDDAVAVRAGKCDACSRVAEPKLYVDHDHRTGQVRGFLCHQCNAALGLLDEDPSRMEALIKYMTTNGLGNLLKGIAVAIVSS
jgi:hypothetical protein